MAKIRKLNGFVPLGAYDLDPKTGAAMCNWIGSDDPSAKWASIPLNILLPWMKPASVPHDLWWSGALYNDGSRHLFSLSNYEFRENLELFADDSFGWAWPKLLRTKLRDARRWEADKAYKVLMSDMCWEIWLKNAEIEPGPEVQG
jgi:hypothetical protein